MATIEHEPLTEDRAGPEFKLECGYYVAIGTLWQITDAYGFCAEELEELKRLPPGERRELLTDGVFITRVA